MRAVAACVLVAGCQLVFPLEGPTDTGDDTAAGSTCADLEGLEFCADFETPGHGLTEFLATPTLNGGTIAEVSGGQSLPNAMDVRLTDSGAAAFAFGDQPFANQPSFTRRYEWKMRGEAFGVVASCNATFARVAIGDTHLLRASVVNRAATLELFDAAGQLVSNSIAALPVGTFDDWTDVVLVTDFRDSQAQLLVAGQPAGMFALPPPAPISGVLFQLGLQTGTIHADCHALFDDVRVTRP